MLCEIDPGLVAAPIFMVFFLVFGFILFFGLILKIFLWWRIFSKAGFSGAFAFLLFAPFGELILLCIMAFSNWPIFNKPAQVIEVKNT
ncbi:MAG: hypothetical protein ABFD79_01735 [Phycisphaerales bacterium]